MRHLHIKKIYWLVATMMASGLAHAADPQSSLSNPDETEALPEVSVQQKRIAPATPEDIARTAAKIEVPLRDIPASVSVVSSEMIEEQGLRNMNQAMIANAPGVQPQMGGGYGISDSFNSRGLALSFLRDTMPDGTAQNNYYRTFYDIERIEVLKGPGSALFGPVGPGGTINVMSKQPQDTPKLTVGTLLGRFDTFNGFVDATGKVADGVAARLIVDAEHTDGYRGLDHDIMEVSPSVRWHYADNKTFTVDVDFRDIKLKPDNYGIVFDNRAKLADVSQDTRYYTPFNTSDQKIRRINISHDWMINDDLSLHTALTNDQRDLYLLRNAIGTIRANNSFSRNVRQQFDDARYTTFQNEVTWKIDTAGIGHTILGGLEFNNTDVDTRRADYTLSAISNVNNPIVTETSLAGLTKTLSFDRTIKSDTVSVYLQDQIALGQYVKVRGGVRNDHVNYEDKGVIGNARAFREIEESKDVFSGNLGAVFQPNSQLAFYAGYSEGGFINLATEATAVATDPETSKQLEIGAKTSFFENKAHLNVALFRSERENYFITLPNASSATPDGSDETKGIELEAEVFPLSNWSLTANAVLQDAQTKSTSVASNATFGISNRSIYGTRPTGVSEKIFSLWSNYKIQSGLAEGVSLGVGAVHKGDAYADNLNLFEVPSYTIYNAIIGYKKSNWEAALILNNLTDKKYYTSPTFAGALPGDPRSAYVSLKFDFK